MDFDIVAYIIRILGRVGFVFLIVGLWRFYNLFASPVLKRKSRVFANLFTFVLLFSFALLLVEFLVDIPWLPLVTMTLNVASVYALAWYLWRNVSSIEQRRESQEFKEYSRAMDALIETLKRPHSNDTI